MVNISAATEDDMAKDNQLICEPRMAHRHASITPVMGLMAYSQCHFEGITLLENPTGEM